MSTAARIEHQLAIYGGTLGAVLVVLGLLSLGAAGYVYLNPPVEQVPPEETDVQQFEASVEHSAVVTGESRLFEPNELLRDQPVYFINATPSLRLSAVADLPADRPVTVSYRLFVSRSASFEGDRFWDRRRVLATDRRTVRDGTARLNTSLRMDELRDERAAIQEELTEGELSSELRLELDYDSPVGDGERYEGTLNASSPIRFSERAYWLPGDLTDEQTRRQLTEATVRTGSPDTTLVGGLGIAGLVLIVGGAAVGLWSTREAEVYELELRVYHARYEEWISEGEFPTGSGNQYVYINSLEDLVDVAIDTGKRVIYDPDIEVYSVVDGDIVYYHAAEPTTVTSWLEFSSE
jgi:hypothetical protein